MGLYAPKERALQVSEENNNQEPEMLQVFQMESGKQFNQLAKSGATPDFEITSDPVKCTGYWEGHNFHWIPLFRYSQPRIPISARWIEGQKFEVLVNGATVYWYHHDPERLKQALSKAKPDQVKATEGRPWIFISTGDGAYAFNCAEEPLKGCTAEANRAVQ